MGLTIHWNLDAGAVPVAQARAKVRALHEAAQRLPFKQVWPIDDLRGDACDYNKNPDENLRWLLIQAGCHLRVPAPPDPHCFSLVDVLPKRLIAFTVDPGNGCETANFGLCRYPATVMFRGKRLRTNLPGWRWKSFCKTQYASNPECGGVQNFLKCHLVVIALLRRAEAMGLVKEVHDEGDYWARGDVKALVEEIGEWNTMLAGIAGQLKDAFEGGVAAPILSYPDFEHLEAKAQVS